jgi:hypothetical protein
VGIFLAGALIGAAAAIAARPVVGPPYGTFWVVVLLPLLRITFSWPVAVLVIVAVFRNQIATLIPRMSKGPGGTEFNFASEQATADAETLPRSAELSIGSSQALVPGTKSAASDNNPSADKAEDRSLRNVPTFVVERVRAHRAQPTDDISMKLAWLEVRYAFEKVYRIVTGSQIDALLFLRARPWGVFEEELKPIYSANPETAKVLRFETWRDYLRNVRLVSLDPEGRYRLAEQGLSFLQYLLEQGYTDRKPL